MSRLRHHITKKLAACFMLLLLVFVYAEKSIHSHEVEVKVTIECSITDHESSASCAICDFKLTRDIDIQRALFEAPVFFQEPGYGIFLLQRIAFAESRILSDRAPPAI